MCIFKCLTIKFLRWRRKRMTRNRRIQAALRKARREALSSRNYSSFMFDSQLKLCSISYFLAAFIIFNRIYNEQRNRPSSLRELQLYT